MGKREYAPLLVVLQIVYSSAYVANNHVPRANPKQELRMNSEDNSDKQPKEHKIVGGSIVYPEYKYPYQAMFAGDHVKCGATIINRNHALTADHCIQIDTPNKDTFVIVGHHRLTSTDVFGPDADEIFGEDLVRVELFIRYEKSNLDDYNDIAILRMERDFVLSDRVQPACIADNLSEYYIGWEAVVTGWGNTVRHHIKPTYVEELKELTLKVLEPESNICYRSGGFFSKETKLCAYKRGEDSCQGDSGGPLAVSQNGKYVLIGVVSSGKGCANSAYSGIYMRVSAFAEWIKKNAGDVCTQESTARPDKLTTSTREPIILWTESPFHL